MQASIIIPVWNGADVLPGCLDSIQEQASDQLLEVICVDNDSEDRSAALIAEHYPQVRLLRQPVNLGFAGGVNAGIDVAQGDVLVLLNQDCIVEPGWLEALDHALAGHPELGVAGCSVSKPDGTIDHLGAAIRRPEAYGVHLAQLPGGEVRDADFVTGAAMAIPRRVRKEVGLFDEGFYPGYYEDADYCYRARRQGFAVACVASAHVTHLAGSRAWQADTVRYQANHCLARYRFVAKHFDSRETTEFFAAELQTTEQEEYLDRAIGRAIAARDLLRQLPDVLLRRQMDLAEGTSGSHRRQLQVGLAQISRQGYATAVKLTRIGLIPPDLERWQASADQQREALDAPRPGELDAAEGEKAAHETVLRALDEQESAILGRLYPLGFAPGGHGARLQQLGYRLRSLWQGLTGHSERLQAELQAVRAARTELCRYQQEGLERRLKLLETLIDYDHR